MRAIRNFSLSYSHCNSNSAALYELYATQILKYCIKLYPHLPYTLFSYAMHELYNIYICIYTYINIQTGTVSVGLGLFKIIQIGKIKKFLEN